MPLTHMHTTVLLKLMSSLRPMDFYCYRFLTVPLTNFLPTLPTQNLLGD